jgi:formyltetrahydrofolate deformylase
MHFHREWQEQTLTVSPFSRNLAGMKNTAILLISCPDRCGIVAAVTTFLHENDGNIIDLEQHVDSEVGVFFMRAEWDLDGFRIPLEDFPRAFQAVEDAFKMKWQLHTSQRRQRIVLFVTREFHCLYDLLTRAESGEWNAEIPLIVSNREDLRSAAVRFGIPYHVFPITPDNKFQQEEAEMELLERHRIDLIVLARYMQIVSGRFIDRFPQRIINIHPSFLPAFAGARPYHAAYERGVKIIGATSHYVTENLDEGPIIEQDIIRVSHRESAEELVRRGKDVEKIVLARAVTAHLEHRVLVFNSRTVVFR